MKNETPPLVCASFSLNPTFFLNDGFPKNLALFLKVARLIFHLLVIAADWLLLIRNLSTNALFTLKAISIFFIQGFIHNCWGAMIATFRHGILRRVIESRIG